MNKKQMMQIIFPVLLAALLLSGTATQAGAANVSREIKLSGFDAVVVSGSWNAQIVQGPQFKIVVTAPEEYVDQVCTLDGGKLTVRQPRKGWFDFSGWWNKSERCKVQITMPVLTAAKISGSAEGVVSGFKTQDLLIDSSGSSDLKIANCDADNLTVECSGSSDVSMENCISAGITISCSGSSEVKGRNCDAGNLALTGSGSSEFSFAGSKVKNLRLDLAGSSDAVIEKMTGGIISGKLRGSSKLVYSGEISGFDVDSSGSSKVRMK